MYGIYRLQCRWCHEEVPAEDYSWHDGRFGQVQRLLMRAPMCKRHWTAIDGRKRASILRRFTYAVDYVRIGKVAAGRRRDHEYERSYRLQQSAIEEISLELDYLDKTLYLAICNGHKSPQEARFHHFTMRSWVQPRCIACGGGEGSLFAGRVESDVSHRARRGRRDSAGIPRSLNICEACWRASAPAIRNSVNVAVRSINRLSEAERPSSENFFERLELVAEYERRVDALIDAVKPTAPTTTGAPT
jgi:hypothetical protein